MSDDTPPAVGFVTWSVPTQRSGELDRSPSTRALDLFDTPPDERFDRITRLACRVLSVPVAVVTLADGDRQWLKSAVGVPCGSQRPEHSVCHRLVAGQVDDPFVVEDLSQDPRFADLPDVRGGSHLRAYAGRRLIVGGRAVGVLAVADRRPRAFDDDELATLADLASWVEAELRADQEQRAAAELDALRRRTEMILSGVAEGVVGVDDAGRVTFVNAAAQDLLGWPRGLLGAELHAATHSRAPDGSVLPVEDCPVTEVLSTGASRRLLHGTFWRYDGTPLPVDWSVGAVLDGADVVGAVVAFSDASQRLHVERMKDEFTAVVSHELRTPLTSVKGALDLLVHGVGGTLPPEASRLVDMSRRNAHRLGRLVDDILDLERSERGALPLIRQPIELGELMAAAAATVEGTAETRSVRIEVDPVPAVVWGDEHRLLQVLTNLLGNAVRFSPEGSRVRLDGDRDERAVRVHVRDEGVGIPEDSLDRVFDRFWQADASTRRERGGTGLGLAIAKKIVESHGGFIHVDSRLGHGSTFSVSLPLRSRNRPTAVDRRQPTDREVDPS